MALKKKMTDAERLKLCKAKPVYEETYKKGVIANDSSQIIERIKREGSFLEMVKHANLDNEIEAVTVKIYFNKK